MANVLPHRGVESNVTQGGRLKGSGATTSLASWRFRPSTPRPRSGSTVHGTLSESKRLWPVMN